MDVIRTEKLRLRIPIDPETDPGQTGMIGPVMSPVTTNSGHLPAKQTSVNPNFAAVIVDMLKRIDAKPGDLVAVGITGSMPAFNVAVYAALHTLKLKPIVIASASASQFGANDPNFLWLDMERVLREKRVFEYGPVAVSRGGIEDRALGLSKEGRRVLDEALERTGATIIRPKDYDDSLAQRWETYSAQAGGAPIVAYINVGGGTSSVGTRAGKLLFKPGLNRSPPKAALAVDSVMTRFALEGVPVIHLVESIRLAERYGLPIAPTEMPAVGQGSVFTKLSYNRYLAAALLTAIVFALFVFVRTDWGFRMMRGGKAKATPGQPEPMV